MKLLRDQLCKCCILFVFMCGTASVKLETDPSEKAFYDCHCHGNRIYRMCAAGLASYVADQRNGTDAYDIGILSGVGEPRNSANRAC